LIARRIPLFEFAIKTELKLHNLNTAEGRINALNATAPLVSQIRDKSLRPEYARLLAGWLGVEVEIVTKAVTQGARNFVPQQSNPVEERTENSWRPDPLEPRLILEREVLKVRVQQPALIKTWGNIEDGAFTHPAYSALAIAINSIAVVRALVPDDFEEPELRALFTELSVEPIRADGEVSDHYVASIVARLREVGISRSIAELKSRLQRLNPVENEDEYNSAFAQLVGLEAQRRELHDEAVRTL
jgi:DNA primase